MFHWRQSYRLMIIGKVYTLLIFCIPESDLKFCIWNSLCLLVHGVSYLFPQGEETQVDSSTLYVLDPHFTQSSCLARRLSQARESLHVPPFPCFCSLLLHSMCLHIAVQIIRCFFLSFFLSNPLKGWKIKISTSGQVNFSRFRILMMVKH